MDWAKDRWVGDVPLREFAEELENDLVCLFPMTTGEVPVGEWGSIGGSAMAAVTDDLLRLRTVSGGCQGSRVGELPTRGEKLDREGEVDRLEGELERGEVGRRGAVVWMTAGENDGVMNGETGAVGKRDGPASGMETLLTPRVMAPG
jgi:hypothetical protein